MLSYHIKLTVYMVCSAQSNPGQLSPSIPFTIFDAGTGSIYQNLNVSISNQYRLEKTTSDECITGDQSVCYYIVIYDLSSVDLPNNAAGYVVSYQRCCRIIDIRNMPDNPASSTFGNTYSIAIPGSSSPSNAQHNSSPQFLVNDTAIVCGNNYFQVPFVASDPDGDSLSYSFCDAWTGGGQSNTPANGPNTPTPNPATAPPYATIPYAPNFGGGAPLGPGVTIDPRTGVISGIAPPDFGEYVVTVCVYEYRNGTYIASSRKELHMKVGDCGAIKATLNPQYVNCKGFDLSFFNQTNGGVQNYFWDFGVTAQTNDTSILAAPSFTYPDTGTYAIKLVVNRGKSCADSTTALAKVYPGFFPGFTFAGICQNKPTQFFDTTRTAYGSVNGWSWDFGDNFADPGTDVSTVKNPSYTYLHTGTSHVQFIVTSTKGCIDTVYKDVTIMDKPPLKAIPKDTLICNGDNVLLGATGTGSFTWTGPNIISDGNTSSPTVQPSGTSKYIVELNDNGCLNHDTVQVRVVNFVTLQMPADSVICATDSVRLHAVTDGLHFTWTPAANISNPNILNPMALPVNNPSVFQLKATIGHCEATGNLNLTLVPYPTANAGPDETICYNGRVQLHGSIVGTSFTWSPTSTLDNPASLDPFASPKHTTTYIFSVTADAGCPKPKKDTVVVNVLPQIFPFAGRDTAVIVGQPLQLNASGGLHYSWSPSTGLNRSDIFNPLAVYDGSQDSIRYKVVVRDANDCADSAYVTVKVFRTTAQIFVPSAFTPNGDGLNDYFRPISVGISHFEYFKVYNRWGQLVYSSNSVEGGWDGKVNGKEQGTASFVWIVKGVDFTGKVFFAKGNVTLVR